MLVLVLIPFRILLGEISPLFVLSKELAC